MTRFSDMGADGVFSTYDSARAYVDSGGSHETSEYYTIHRFELDAPGSSELVYDAEDTTFLQKRVARFRPHRTDDLVDGAEAFIGDSATFQNVGEDQWSPLDGRLRNAPFAWVPERDLEFLD